MFAAEQCKFMSSTEVPLRIPYLLYLFIIFLSFSLSLSPIYLNEFSTLHTLCLALFYSTSLCSNNMLRPKPRRCTHTRTHTHTYFIKLYGFIVSKIICENWVSERSWSTHKSNPFFGGERRNEWKGGLKLSIKCWKVPYTLSENGLDA